MLTVIIFKDSSKDFINKYRTLFEPYLESGKIAFCLWDERGTTLQSALGDLFDTIKYTDKWKAMVVIPPANRDSIPEGEQTDPNNPFDYLINAGEPEEVKESSIPLIRLAQMLGGVPRPSMHWENQWEDAAKTSMHVVSRESDEYIRKQEEAWQNLSDKYSFEGDLPVSLYLFTAKRKRNVDIPTITDKEIANRYEIHNSQFVHRNRYPDRARFITKNCCNPGNVHYDEELFDFWMTAITIAINDLPTGTFEAYKLYEAEAVVDNKKYKEVLSAYYNRLNAVLFNATRQIQDLGTLAAHVSEDTEVPFLDVTVPVEFEDFMDEDLKISYKKIGLTGNCPKPEEPWWHENVRECNESMEKITQRIRKVLDRASSNCTYMSQLTHEEIFELNEYQREVMEERLTDLEKEILTFNIYSVMPINTYRKDSRRKEAEGAKEMQKRMTRKSAIVLGLVVALIYLGGFITDFIYQFEQGFDLLTILALAMGGVAILSLAGIGSHFYFKSIIVNVIRDFNDMVKTMLRSVQHAGDVFSEYLSNCCTYMRGRRFLQYLKEKEHLTKDDLLLLSEHVNQLEIQLENIRNWMMDFNMTPAEDTGEFANGIDFDFDIKPSQNRRYLMDLDFSKLLIPGPDGGRCRSPYPFITNLAIERIPVYEKVTARESIQELLYEEEETE